MKGARFEGQSSANTVGTSKAGLTRFGSATRGQGALVPGHPQKFGLAWRVHQDLGRVNRSLTPMYIGAALATPLQHATRRTKLNAALARKRNKQQRK